MNLAGVRPRSATSKQDNPIVSAATATGTKYLMCRETETSAASKATGYHTHLCTT